MITHLTLDVAFAQLVGGHRGRGGGADAETVAGRAGGRLTGGSAEHVVGLESHIHNQLITDISKRYFSFESAVEIRFLVIHVMGRCCPEVYKGHLLWFIASLSRR